MHDIINTDASTDIGVAITIAIFAIVIMTSIWIAWEIRYNNWGRGADIRPRLRYDDGLGYQALATPSSRLTTTFNWIAVSGFLGASGYGWYTLFAV